MFGFFKKKKNKDVFADNPNKESSQEESKEEDLPSKTEETEEKKEEIDESNLSPKEKEKLAKLRSVKSKISHILQSKDIEIVDENEGDDYEYEAGPSGDVKKQQQDYDSLKAMYGKGGKDKKKELTLEIDDFDYTYVGKYVEELDTSHLKDLKRIKLPNKHAKLIKKLSIGFAACLVVVISGVVAYNMLKVQPEHLTGATLTQTSQSYYRNELFDFTGLYIKVKYSTGRTEDIPLTIDHFVGYEGGVVEEYDKTLKFSSGSGTRLTFHYEGFVGGIDFKSDLVMDINIMTKSESGISVIYSTGVFDLEADEYITEKHIIPLVDYENYSSTKIDLSSVSISIDGINLNYDKNAKGFKVTKSVTSTSVIKVSYRIKTQTVSVDLVRGESFVTSDAV